MRVLDSPEQLMIKFMNKSINVKQKTNKARQKKQTHSIHNTKSITMVGRHVSNYLHSTLYSIRSEGLIYDAERDLLVIAKLISKWFRVGHLIEKFSLID